MGPALHGTQSFKSINQDLDEPARRPGLRKRNERANALN